MRAQSYGIPKRMLPPIHHHCDYLSCSSSGLCWDAQTEMSRIHAEVHIHGLIMECEWHSDDWVKSYLFHKAARAKRGWTSVETRNRSHVRHSRQQDQNSIHEATCQPRQFALLWVPMPGEYAEPSKASRNLQGRQGEDMRVVLNHPHLTLCFLRHPLFTSVSASVN